MRIGSISTLIITTLVFCSCKFDLHGLWDVEIRRGALVVHVTDSTGRPADSIRVGAYAYPAYGDDTHRSGFTDSTGTVVFDNLPSWHEKILGFLSPGSPEGYFIYDVVTEFIVLSNGSQIEIKARAIKLDMSPKVLHINIPRGAFKRN